MRAGTEGPRSQGKAKEAEDLSRHAHYMVSAGRSSISKPDFLQDLKGFSSNDLKVQTIKGIQGSVTAVTDTSGDLAFKIWVGGPEGSPSERQEAVIRAKLPHLCGMTEVMP